MKILRLVLILVLLIAVVFLSFSLYKTIDEPIQFMKKQEVRDKVAIQKLKDIRSVQLAYKAIHNKYISTFDSLKLFVGNDSIPVLKQIGDPNDTTVVVKTETILIPAIDSLFNGNRAELDSLNKIPYSNGKMDFKSGIVVKNEIDIPAFEVSLPYRELYSGLSKKYWAELRNESMRVGSMRDATTSGNWGER